MTDFEKAVCFQCIEDKYLSEIVRRKGEKVRCDLCNKNSSPAYTATDLGLLLEPLLREHILLGEQRKVFRGPDDDKGDWEQAGDPLDYFVSTFLGQDFDFLQDIVSAVCEAEDCFPQDGDEPFFNDLNNYVSRPPTTYELLEEWRWLQHALRHSQRFFNEEGRSFFKSIFENINVLQSHDENNWELVGVVQELSAGFEIFRARQITTLSTFSEVHDDPYYHVGPPPPELTNSGRMNAEGVVMLYGALDVETAVSEMRPPLGGYNVAITLRTTSPLKVLDFRRLENVFTPQSLSVFQPDYLPQIEKGAFLKKLHSLISLPVVPGREAEYLITQMMSEYLRYLHEPNLDGILFSSVQRQDGVNIVLFPVSGEKFPIEYVNDSIQLFKTKSVSYEHSPHGIYKLDDDIRVYDQDFEPDTLY